jgi:hypothetical protein
MSNSTPFAISSPVDVFEDPETMSKQLEKRGTMSESG